ncbi:MAG: hypothetical protein WBP81_22115, partial [Solirubrobacteraceae bacterium]
TGDWRDWRPAIWLAMLGVAVALLINPPYFSATFFGAAIGAALRIRQRRRRAAAAGKAARGGRGRRSSGSGRR